MKRQLSLLFGLAVLLIANLACGASGLVSTPTSIPQTATSAPSATPEPPFELGAEYSHPSGLFTFTPPKDWAMTEKPYGAVFVSPDQKDYIGITVTNTIYPLAQDALQNFITANEENRFSSYSQYKQVSSTMHLDQGEALIAKTLVDENGTPQAVETFYKQSDAAVYVVHMWATIESPSQIEAIFNQYANVAVSFTINSSTIAQYPAYPWTFHFTGANDVYEIDIPQPWAHSHEDFPNVADEVFFAPDDNAAIEILVYDDGKQTMNQSIAGKVALEVLNQVYTKGSNDVKITSDKPGQAQGTERLDWKSKTGGYQGATFFRGNGTNLTLLTFLFVNGFQDDYQFMVDYTMSTYTLP